MSAGVGILGLGLDICCLSETDVDAFDLYDDGTAVDVRRNGHAQEEDASFGEFKLCWDPKQG